MVSRLEEWGLGAVWFLACLVMSNSIFAAEPAAVQAKLAAAEALRVEKKHDEARAAFLQIAANDPDKAVATAARFKAAQCLFDKKEFQAYLDESETLLTESPDADDEIVLDARLTQGKCFNRLKKHQQAIDKLDEIAYIKSKSTIIAQALLVKGDSLSRMRQHDEARAAFKRVLTVPNTPELVLQARCREVDCYYGKGDYDAFATGAKKLLTENLPADNHEVQTMKFHLAHVPAMKGDPGKTAEELDKFIQENPAFRQIDLAKLRCGSYYMDASFKLAGGTSAAEKDAAFQLAQKGKHYLELMRRQRMNEIETDPAAASSIRIWDLMFHCYQYQRDYAGLAQAATEMSQRFQAPSQQWASAMIWKAMALICAEPADYGQSTRILDDVIAAEIPGVDWVNQPDANLPVRALMWRILVARKQNDSQNLSNCIERLKSLPEGPAKSRAIQNIQQNIGPVVSASE